MYRSILEGIAFEQLFAICSVEKNIGTKVNNLVAIVGGTTKDVWCHIIADITGKEICIPQNTEASAAGAGIASSVGAGWNRTFKKAGHEMVEIKKHIHPDKEKYKNISSWLHFIKKYIRVYRRQENVFENSFQIITGFAFTVKRCKMLNVIKYAEPQIIKIIM